MPLVAAMTEPAAFFSSFLHALPDVLFVYDLDARRVSYVSAAYEQLFPGRRAARVNEELAELHQRIHPDDRPYLAHCWPRWLQGRLLDAAEFRLLHPDGTEQWLSLRPHYHAPEDGPRQFGGLLQDITATKESLAYANRFAAKKNATLEILSHDLAGPFTMIQQLGNYFRETVRPLDNARLNDLIDVMQATCRDSINLIHDFVDNEFMSSVNVELRLERVELKERIASMLVEYKRSERHLAKHFHFEAPPEPVYVTLDDNKFMQVLNNLLSNAVKFTLEGGHITLRLEPHPGRVLVAVADDGVGIDEHLHPVLFDRFTKARRPGLRGEKTTGLGMSIIKTIVELHQGRIWFESAAGQGTTFFVELPNLAEPATVPES